MADLKTTNIFGDAYINNKVGIATNAPATRLQIGQLSPTAATEGIQFGDDTSARLHRINTGHIRATGGFSSATFIIADNYLQTNNNLIYPASQTATQRLEVGNASGNAWIDGLTIAQGGNVTVYNNLTVNNAATVTNDLTVNGNTYLGNANGDTVYVNDTIRIGATDSGDASLFFGEGSVAGSDYGARWYWDSGYTFTWYTRNAGTDTALFDYVTNDLNYINWRRHFHMQNKEINYNAQIHFNAGTRFVGNNTSYLNFRSDSAGAGGILVQDGNATTKGYTGYWDSAGGGILNNSGNWAVRYNFGNANSGGQLYGDWSAANFTATTFTGTLNGNANAVSFTEVELNAPVTVSGTWTTGNGSEWGEPKFGTSFNQFRYTDGNGPYVEYNIPANHHACFISQLQWDTGGYADCHGVQSDGDLVFLRRINTRQLVENSNHGNPIQHDGATVTFVGSGLQAFSKIRITNRSGRIHMTGIAFTRQVDDGYEGTGMLHPAQISHQGSGSGLDADLLDGYNSATANTANTIVLRDGSGNFSAGTITAALSGNATTATALTSMNISQFTNNSGYLTSAVTSLAGTTNRITVSGATGAVTLNLPQDIHTGASPTFAGLSLTSVSTTGATITNLTGAYQNTTVYDSPRTQSATPSRGIRAPASSIQFTDSYAIAPFYTYRSTGDWPVPYGIGWGTGGESSGIFQRYASNGYSFGDMIFYTGNDGSGAFSFRRHTWEGTTYFAQGSGELNTELFRIDWSGNVSMLGTLNGSANSATLYPNNGAYGSWKIGGTRGGWYGIEFESGTILMANSNESGFYRNGVGWQMWWSGGTGYVQKGASGGGTQATILESSNYTSYTPGLGTNNTLTGINTINNTSNTVINNQSGNLGLTMFQATAGTDAYMTFHISSDYAAYLGLGGAENDLVYGGWSAGNNRHRILHSGNAAYAWNMNQYVRTTDTCSFAGLTVSNTINGSVTGNAGTVTNGLYTTGGQTIAGITYFSNGESINAYGIRGRFTNEYLHLYNKVGVGHPGGWGAGESSTPDKGLSTYGGLNIAYGDNGLSTFNGVIRANSNIRQGADLARPLSSWSVAGTSTGMVIFSFPGNTGNYGMVHCVFDIYEYNANTVSTVIVGGHNWNGAWYNFGANVIGKCGKSVRLGVKDSKFCVVFGGAASSWEYGTIILRKIHNGGFYTGIMDMGGSFTTQQTTTESFSNISGDLRALRTSADFIADGGVTGTSFSGAGTGLTGTASSLSIGGNATTATTLQTARAINGVSFNGSAAITVNGLNYNVNNEWLRENGDDAHFQMYGNSRTMIYRTDGNTNTHGGGAYAHIFYYGGSADANRMFIINTDGRLWSNYHGWLDTMSISGNAATAGTCTGNAATVTNGIYTTNYYAGLPLGKRRYRIHSADSTSLNSSITNAECGFTYGGSGEPTGPYIAFGGLGGAIDYSCQLVGAYSGGGNDFKIRTRNDDSITWNTWRTIVTDGNYTSYSPALTGTGASGTWGISVTGNAVTAGGLAVHGGVNNEANKIVRTDGNGYIMAGWINTPSGDMPDTQSINRIYCSDDQYIRYKGVADFKQQIGLTYKNATPRSSNTTNSDYWTGIMGWTATDWNSMSDWGCGFVDSWDSPANRPPVGTHHVGIQALHYTNGTARYGWQMANGGGNNRWWLRDSWGSSFSTWFEILTSTNYTSFSPSLTGTGASGTWSISITGNAGTATSATSATYLNSSNYIARCGSSGNANTDFQNTPAGSVRHNGDDSNLTNSPGGTWWFYDNYRHSNSSNYWGIQVAWGWEDNANKLATRNITGGTFGGWVYYLNSSNAAYAYNMNQYVRTTDSPTFAAVSATTFTGALTGTASGNLTAASSLTAGNLSGTIPSGVLGNSTLYIGTTAITLNRTSSSQTLTGVSIDGNAATATSLTNFTNQSGARYTTDFNSIVTTGFFNAEATPTNSPGGSYGQLICSKGIDTGLQIYGGYTTDNLWFRGWGPSLTFTGWRTVIHSGNIASQTVATAGNATTAGGLAVQTGTNYEVNKIVRTDGNGYVNFGWINTVSGDNGTTAIDRIYASSDAYIRYYTPANFRTVLDVPTRNGSGVTNFGINTAPSNRLHINGDGTNPAIRVDNGAVVLAASAASNSKTFYGWLPISIAGTTKWIQMYN